MCAALRGQLGAKTGDVNEWEVAAATHAVQAISWLRAGEAARISAGWEGELDAVMRRRAEECLVWPEGAWRHGA